MSGGPFPGVARPPLSSSLLRALPPGTLDLEILPGASLGPDGALRCPYPLRREQVEIHADSAGVIAAVCEAGVPLELAIAPPPLDVDQRVAALYRIDLEERTTGRVMRSVTLRQPPSHRPKLVLDCGETENLDSIRTFPAGIYELRLELVAHVERIRRTESGARRWGRGESLALERVVRRIDLRPGAPRVLIQLRRR